MESRQNKIGEEKQKIIDLINAFIKKLESYVDAKEKRVNEIRTNQQPAVLDSNSLVGLAFGYIKSEITVKFFKSGIVLNLELSRNKIQLASELIANLEEAKEDIDDESLNTEIANCAMYFVLDAKQKHAKLIEKFGGRLATLGGIISELLQEVDRYASKEIQNKFEVDQIHNTNKLETLNNN